MGSTSRVASLKSVYDFPSEASVEGWVGTSGRRLLL